MNVRIKKVFKAFLISTAIPYVASIVFAIIGNESKDFLSVAARLLVYAIQSGLFIALLLLVFSFWDKNILNTGFVTAFVLYLFYMPIILRLFSLDNYITRLLFASLSLTAFIVSMNMQKWLKKD